MVLLAGKMHYCKEQDGDMLDPYYLVPEGESIDKDW